MNGVGNLVAGYIVTRPGFDVQCYRRWNLEFLGAEGAGKVARFVGLGGCMLAGQCRLLLPLTR